MKERDWGEKGAKVRKERKAVCKEIRDGSGGEMWMIREENSELRMEVLKHDGAF